MKTRDNLLKRIMTVALSIALAVSMLPLGTPDIYAATTTKSDAQAEKKEQKISCQLLYTKEITDSDFNLNATAKTSLSYLSTNWNVATVDRWGNVSIRGVGIALITLFAAPSSEYQAETLVVTVIVTGRPQSISCSSSFNKTIFDDPFYLNATANTKLSYKSNKSKVATVDEDGQVVIQGAGTARITITAEASGEYKAAVKTTTIKVSNVEFAKPTVTLKIKKDKATITWNKVKYADVYAVQHQYKKGKKWIDGGYMMFVELSKDTFTVFNAKSIGTVPENPDDFETKTFTKKLKAVNSDLKKTTHRYRVCAMSIQPEATSISAWKSVKVK